MRTFLMVAALLAPAAAGAAESDVERGRELAVRWCAACHVVGPVEVPGGDIGPPFAAIANKQGQSEQAIRNFLAQPHPPMPDPQLGASEFDDLAAYIMSLEE